MHSGVPSTTRFSSSSKGCEPSEEHDLRAREAMLVSSLYFEPPLIEDDQERTETTE